MRNRAALLCVGLGLPLLAWILWTTTFHRTVRPHPNDSAAPPENQAEHRPAGSSATDQSAPDVSSQNAPDARRSEFTFNICQYPDDTHPLNDVNAIQVRLNLDRLRAYGLTSNDVMSAFREVVEVGSSARIDPLPGVVLVKDFKEPERYANTVLKAFANGNGVKLKDVASVILISKVRSRQEKTLPP